MRLSKRIITAFIWIPVVAINCVAQPRPLTVSESVDLGLSQSRQLHLSEMRLVSAQAKASESSSALYPSLKMQISYQRLSSVPEFSIKIPFGGMSPIAFPIILDNYMAKASFQQPLFTGWKLESISNSAEYSARSMEYDVVKDRAELVFQIKSLYWNVFRAKEVLRMSEENVKQISSHLQDIRNMEKQGLATSNDVLKVQVQLASSELIRNDANNALHLAMLAFDAAVGLSLDTQIEPITSLSDSSDHIMDLKQLVAHACEKRPDIKSMEWRVKAAESGVTMARSGWMPQLFLTANYYYSRPNQRIFPAKDEFNDTWDVGVVLQMDLWNNLSTVYQTTQARAQLEQSTDALTLLKDGVAVEVTQSYLALAQAKRRIELTKLAIDQAQENFRVTSEKFRTGLTTNSELLDAEVAQLQTKVQHVQALVDHEIARARLEKSLGTSEGN